MKKYFIYFLLSILLFNCEKSAPPVETSIPVYGKSGGSKVLGNGQMVMLCSSGKSMGNVQNNGLHHLFIKDYSRNFLKSLRLETVYDGSPLELKLNSSDPYFASYTKKGNRDLTFETRAYVLPEANQIIISAKIQNHSQKYLKVNIIPKIEFNRPYIFDYHENYMNYYVDEYIFSSGFSEPSVEPDDYDLGYMSLVLSLKKDEVKEFHYIISIATSQVAAQTGRESLLKEINLLDYAETQWELWLNSGIVPDFRSKKDLNFYKINLLSLKALNLNGAVPADISGQFVTDMLPQLYPRDAMMTARALLETGHYNEVKDIIDFWTKRTQKQEGEWYARYDAFGNPNAGGTGAQYDVPEWDSNAYYVSLVYSYYTLTGKWIGNRYFLRSLLRFIEGHLHSNGLAYEGGIVEWPGYLPSTNMTLVAAFNTASKIDKIRRGGEDAEDFMRTARRISYGIETLWDDKKESYADIRGINNRWNSTTLFGWIWGYSNNVNLEKSSEFYWKNCRKSQGGIQYFEDDDYGDDLFYFSTAALAQYYLATHKTDRFRVLKEWMEENSNHFGMMPERIIYPKTEGIHESKASPLTWANAEYVMTLLEGARHGILSNSDSLTLNLIKNKSYQALRFTFPNSRNLEIEEINELLKVDSLWTQDNSWERQNICSYVQSLKFRKSGFHYELKDYPSEIYENRDITLNFNEKFPPGVSFISMTSSLPAGWKLIEKSSDNMSIRPAISDFSHDQKKSALLTASVDFAGDTLNLNFPLHFSIISPFRLSLTDSLVSDSLFLIVDNRSSYPLTVYEDIFVDTLPVYIPAGLTEIIPIPLQDSLKLGSYSIEPKIIQESDTSQQILRFYKVKKVDISGLWDLYPGENANQINEIRFLSEKAWEQVFVPAFWEDQGFSEMDGAHWYRLHFDFPEEWKSNSIMLEFGGIDDEDICYINDKKLGSGKGWTQLRRYPIAGSMINWGRINTIYVKVTDLGYSGGIWKAPVSIIIY